VKQHCNVRVVTNESLIVTGEAQEASNILTLVSLWPINNCMCLMFLSVEAVHVNVNAAEVDFRTCRGTVCTSGCAMNFLWQCNPFSDMYYVFPLRLAVIHTIVKVHCICILLVPRCHSSYASTGRVGWAGQMAGLTSHANQI